MSDRTTIKIFIASSDELETERKESILLILELNERYPHLHLDAVLFEYDTSAGNFPGKKRIQDGINPLLIDSDIVVALFYSKAGEFTKEEFDLALSQDKKVYLYLKEGFTPRNTEEGKKYLEVLELKDKVEKEGALRYQQFITVNDYYGLLYRDLEKYLDITYPRTDIAHSPAENMPFATTVLAISYYNNFVANLVAGAQYAQEMDINGVKYTDFRLNIVLPNDLKASIREKATVFYKKHGFAANVLQTEFRRYFTWFQFDSEKAPVAVMYDMPSMLGAIEDSVEFVLQKGQDNYTKTKNDIVQKELNNFRKVLQMKIDESPLAKTMVVIVDEF